jgi:glutamine synthetase
MRSGRTSHRTLTPLPWKPEVGWLSCNLVHNDVELAHGPRNVLRSVQAKLLEHGVTLKTGVECEFFIIDGAALPAGASSAALADAMDVQSKPCYDAQALMRRYDLISELCEHMEALGWGPYQADRAPLRSSNPRGRAGARLMRLFMRSGRVRVQTRTPMASSRSTGTSTTA